MSKGKEKIWQAMLDSFGDYYRRYDSRRLLAELQEYGFEVGATSLDNLCKLKDELFKGDSNP